ncbi:coth protein-domain-containing protein [Mycotypha africana]|uniref:coth protein-domain-containing protein n=1 Tax=Mycotypha africana TaxID=64632 RepID=UPI0023009B0C|nr:coth protein-domain-containing protein [Mycotypha africana]KAI8981845.1 coth protein-domain-containing protein [Mycotypha africana]
MNQNPCRSSYKLWPNALIIKLILLLFTSSKVGNMLAGSFLVKLFALTAILGAQAEGVPPTTIQYNVIKVLSETDRMGVIVDNITYVLRPNVDSPIIHSGEAPVAALGYHYIEFDQNNNTRAEPFLRSPSQENTAYEFYNRTQNTYPIAELPVLYAPLNTINKVKSDLHPENQITTIHIQGDNAELHKLHKSNMTEDFGVHTNVTFITLNHIQKFEKVELSLSGRSSRWMPKFSYGIKLAKKDRFHNYRRLKLRSLASDPSYLREKISYDMIQSTGILSSGFSYARVIMNGQQLGLYGLVETFKDPWIANSFEGGDTERNFGNLYQATYSSPASSALNITSDLSYYENITHYQLGQYTLKEGSLSKHEESNFKPLQDFTKFIAETGSSSNDLTVIRNADNHNTAPMATVSPPTVKETETVKEWRKHLNTDSFLRSMALEILLAWADGYLTMADNYYLYQNPKENNAFFYIPTDFDMTMGNTLFNISMQYSGNYHTVPNALTRPLFRKILEVPEFKQQFENYVKDIAKNLVNPAILNIRIDDIASMIQNDVDWDQNECTHIGSNVFTDMGYKLDGIPFEDIKNHPEKLDFPGAQELGSGLPPAIDLASMIDMMKRFNQSISFHKAVNGPIEGHPSLVGVKEFIKHSSDNTLYYLEKK